MEQRKHLNHSEVEKFLAATKHGRHAERDKCLFLLMYRHGLRVSEACKMELSQVDLDGSVLYVSRLKRGLSTTHPLRPDELKVIKAWLRVRPKSPCPALFLSQKDNPLSRNNVWKLAKAYGEAAGLAIEVHPHMFRHACGYSMANQGADTLLIRDYLGHRNIQNTTVYTAANAARFNGYWR